MHDPINQDLLGTMAEIHAPALRSADEQDPALGASIGARDHRHNEYQFGLRVLGTPGSSTDTSFSNSARPRLRCVADQTGHRHTLRGLTDPLRNQ